MCFDEDLKKIKPELPPITPPYAPTNTSLNAKADLNLNVYIMCFM